MKPTKNEWELYVHCLSSKSGVSKTFWIGLDDVDYFDHCLEFETYKECEKICGHWRLWIEGHDPKEIV